MNKTITILGILTVALLLAACNPSTGVNSDSLPQVNVDDYDSTTTISDLFALSGNHECNWDFNGLADSGVYPTSGSFTMSSDGSYYFENTVESDLSGTIERYAKYDAASGEFYSWNNQASAPIGVKMSAEMYTNTVVDNTIAYRTYFDMLENVDYGIECEPVSSVTLASLPDLQWIG